MAARLGYDPFFAWAKQTVVVQVWRERGSYQARLQLVDEQGVAHGTRGLSSRQGTCDELFDAAALAISIALDSLPKDVTEPEPPPTPPPTPTPAPTPAPMPAPAPTDTRSSPPRPFVGIDALASVGLAPAPAVGLSLFAGLRSRALSVAAELRADAPASAPSASGPGRVGAHSYEAAIVPCAHAGAVSLCGVGSVGLLYASSAGITDPRSNTGFFACAGARVGLEWPLSETISLRVRLDGLVDLRRTTLQIGSAPAWPAPLLAGTAGAGLAAHFE